MPGCDLVVLDAVEDAADLGKPHRGAVAVGDDQWPVGLRVHQLSGRLYGGRLVAPVERAGGNVDIAAADGLLDLGECNAARRQRIRVELDAHRILLRSVHLHLRHATDGRNLLREQVLGVFGHRRQRQRGRGKHDVQDRRIGGIHLALRWRVGHR